MIIHHTKTKLPQGYKSAGIHCGLKENNLLDLGILLSNIPAPATALFTKNLVCGAPIIVGKEIIKKNCLQAFIVNSKISNVATGQEGIDNVHKTIKKTAKIFQLQEEHILVSSTGLIAHQLPINKILNGIEKLVPSNSPMDFAKAIMTTDKTEKILSCSVGDATITMIAKGAGMIAPNMATMLVYIVTDAKINAQKLHHYLTNSVTKTFNCLSIDSDTSTSDTIAIMANGLIKEIDHELFQIALNELSLKMTKLIAVGGEGANRIITVNIKNAHDHIEAKKFAQSIVNSPLIKTMCHGGDPNIGRILMALGKVTDNTLAIDKLSFSINNSLIFKKGEKLNFNEKNLRKTILCNEVIFDIDLGINQGSASAYGCDLSQEYLDENASYYSS